MFATIDGEKQPPREISKEQWNRLWLVDKSEQHDYKIGITGLVFKDRLQISASEEKAATVSLPEQSADEEPTADVADEEQAEKKTGFHHKFF